MKVRLYSERLRTEVQLFIAEVTEEVTTFTQHLLYASIPYIIFIIIFILTYIMFAFEAYYLAASAKYEWARYQRYKRIRDLRLQRNNLEQNEVRIENGNAQ